MEILSYITQRKEKILRMLEIDHKTGADIQENMARLKELERIEKTFKKVSPEEYQSKQKEIKTEFCHECGSQMVYTKGFMVCPCCGYSVCCCAECNG